MSYEVKATSALAQLKAKLDAIFAAHSRGLDATAIALEVGCHVAEVRSALRS